MHRINPKDLLLDHPLPWDVFDNSGALLLCKGYRITRESQREVLLGRGLYVAENLLGASKQAPEPRRHDAFRLWESIITELDALLQNMRVEFDFRCQIESLGKLIHELTQRSADTSLAAIILTGQKQYPIVHSIHVAVICDLIAQRLGWQAPRRLSLVCAALTMNLAMLDLQQTLCAQRIAPSPAQRQDILRHPRLAVELLKEVGVNDPLWLKAVAEHHERQGGGGYPYGISGPGEEAILIQTADIFTAKVSPRAARKPVSPKEAARSLYLESGGGQSNLFVSVLIKEIGIFPPGTFVRLANQETALVTRRSDAANAPRVLSLVNPQGMAYALPLPRDTTRNEYQVTQVVPREQVKFQIDPEKIWRQI